MEYDDDDFIFYCVSIIVLAVIVITFVYFMIKRKRNRDRRAQLTAAFVASTGRQPAQQLQAGGIINASGATNVNASLGTGYSVYTVPNVHAHQQQHNGYPIITHVSYMPPNQLGNAAEGYQMNSQPPPYHQIATAPAAGQIVPVHTKSPY